MFTLWRSWQFKTRAMICLIAILVFYSSVFVWTWRSVCAPWPRWVLSVHTSGDFQAATEASVAAVEGRIPGVAPESAIGELIVALDDPYEGTRCAVSTALGRTGPRAANAIPKLLVLLRDPPPVSYHAAHALGQIVSREHSDFEAVLSALFVAAERPFPLVRVYAIGSLIQLVGQESPRRADLDRLLTRSLNDDSPLIRSLAGLGLIKTGRGQEARPSLVAFRPGEEGYENAQLGLGLLGSRTEDALESLRKARLMASEIWLKKAAQEALSD